MKANPDHDIGTLAPVVRRAAQPLQGRIDDFEVILARARLAQLVLIGEASHGTHDFYRVRCELTKQLIREGRVSAVVVEADWPDTWPVHRYVTGRADAAEAAADALGAFRRFPQWMWRNADVLDFVGWLRAHNEALPPARRVGFLGMDLYGLHASIDAVVHYLDDVDPAAAERARARYRCFDAGGIDPQRYGRLASLGLTPSCERAVVDQLRELQEHAGALLRRDGLIAAEDRFFVEQNARLIRNAERYYRVMFGHPAASWNVRDRHMVDMVLALQQFLHAEHRPGALVLWAHNSHLGDARATEMHELGELNVGQLVRERFGPAATLVGFTSFDGTVTAATSWDGPAQCMRVRPALPQSYEALFHAVAADVPSHNVLIDLAVTNDAVLALSKPRLERAIGVIYRPETERHSHYFASRLPLQFDFVVHLDRTRAVEPLERYGTWSPLELPETYPSAL